MRVLALALAGSLFLLPGCSAADAPSAGSSASDVREFETEGTPLPGEESPGPLEERQPTQTEAPGDVGSNELPTTGVDEAVAIEDGLTVRVLLVEDTRIDAQGPGEIAGPGKAVQVELRNETDARIDLGGVAVTMELGGQPAIDSYSPPANPFMGTLEPGDRAAATYVYLIPDGASGRVVLRVEYSGSENVAVVQL